MPPIEEKGGAAPVDVSGSSIKDLMAMLGSENEAHADPASEGKSETQEHHSEAAHEAAESTAPESETGTVQEHKEEEDPTTDLTAKGLKKRFHKLTSENRDLKRQLAERQPAPAAGGDKQGVASPAPVAAAPKEKPQSKDFADYDAYTEALADWKLDQRKAADVQAESAKQSQVHQAKRAQTWNEREAAVKADPEYADYDEVLKDVKIPPSPAQSAIYEALLDSEIGPKVAYFLAENPDEIKRMSALPPARAAAEIGKIEARLTSAPAPKPPAETKPLPKPPANVGGKSTPATPDLNDKDLSMAAFKKLARSGLTRRPNF